MGIALLAWTGTILGLENACKVRVVEIDRRVITVLEPFYYVRGYFKDKI